MHVVQEPRKQRRIDSFFSISLKLSPTDPGKPAPTSNHNDSDNSRLSSPGPCLGMVNTHAKLEAAEHRIQSGEVPQMHPAQAEALAEISSPSSDEDRARSDRYEIEPEEQLVEEEWPARVWDRSEKTKIGICKSRRTVPPPREAAILQLSSQYFDTESSDTETD
jgi:hypothetical protein